MNRFAGDDFVKVTEEESDVDVVIKLLNMLIFFRYLFIQAEQEEARSKSVKGGGVQRPVV